AQGVQLLVVETNAHRLVRVPVGAEIARVDQGAIATQRPATILAGGTLEFEARFTAPAGQHLDDRFGDPTRLSISATPAEFILEGAGSEAGLGRSLVLNPEISAAVLHITARAATCDGGADGEVAEHAACHLYQQDWGIPVIVADSAGRVDVTDAEAPATRLVLDLRGIND
ncbi:MAG: hypothetical protein Q4C71_03835, partial [Microbacteriaceae bacterium]|nr:hypothetical protein [Microbacteriaceae bacterium]